ncbi:MAG: CDP-diacylglycerol--glycerol-3-phosphate 3-phosphatidyltransferase [Planctomycetota bacterium]
MSSHREWLNLPNKITIARLLIAVLLFVFLSLLISDVGLKDRSLVLNWAAWIFIVCVATDWLDGWLARRFGMVTAFGRIADPFVDKLVVCGTFIYLVELTDLIRPWFAVILVAREFLVTGLRSFIEMKGIPFGARWGGKIKMILQSITIPAVLFYQANYDPLPASEPAREFFHEVAWALVIATLIATLLSAWDYVYLSIRALRAEPAEEGAPS